AQQIGGRNRRRAVVYQRVIIQRVVFQHSGVENGSDEMPNIVDEGERRDAPRSHSEKPMEVCGAAKGKPRRRQPRRQFLEVDTAFLEHDGEPESAFLVLQKQALAMRSRKT